MLYLFISENRAASAVTRLLELKKTHCRLPFDLFQNDTVLLCRTTGQPAEIAAAAGSLLTAFPLTSTDLVISMDTAEPLHPDVPGDWVFCTGVRGPARRQSAGRATPSLFWYPDLLFAHPFPEGGIISEFPRRDALPYWSFYDPGAFSFVQAAGCFVAPHQIIMLRCRDFHTGLLPETLSPLLSWCTHTATLLPPQKTGLTETELTAIQQLAGQMCLSHTMVLQLQQLLLYHTLCGTGLWDGLEDIREICSAHPCSSKTEGKKQFEQLRKRILL